MELVAAAVVLLHSYDSRIVVSRLDRQRNLSLTLGWGPSGKGRWSDAGKFNCGRPRGVGGDALQLTWDDSQTAGAGWYQVWIDIDRGAGSRERVRD